MWPLSLSLSHSFLFMEGKCPCFDIHCIFFAHVTYIADRRRWHLLLPTQFSGNMFCQVYHQKTGCSSVFYSHFSYMLWQVRFEESALHTDMLLSFFKESAVRLCGFQCCTNEIWHLPMLSGPVSRLTIAHKERHWRVTFNNQFSFVVQGQVIQKWFKHKKYTSMEK